MNTVKQQSSQVSAAPLRILFFAPKECWPPDTGAKLRNYYLARELSERARVTYLGFADTQTAAGNSSAKMSHPNAQDADLPSNIVTLCERVITVPREQSYSVTKIVQGAFGSTPLPVLNYTTHTMAETLTRLLAEQDFDLVQVESIHLAKYLPILRAAKSRPRIICDWHNVESELMWRYSERAPNLARRWYAQLTARRMAALEQQLLTEFDAHITVSERDREQLLKIAPQAHITAIENGVDSSYFAAAEIARAHAHWHSTLAPQQASTTDTLPPRRRIIFVGSMDYHPNIEAVLDFAQTVWPQVQRQHPEFVFTIVGRNPAQSVLQLASQPGIEVTGTVADVRPYYHEAIASVVPLKMGAGSRLKILEAMAAGVPIISTTLGAEGLAVRHGEHIAITDSHQAMIQELLDLPHQTEQWQRRTKAARAQTLARYDWTSLGAALFDVHSKLAGRQLARHSAAAS